MSESGQPGAATPGEHGDGTGHQDDLAKTGSGWAPPATGWAPGAATPGGWPRADLTGWASSSPRHGDLPGPLPGLPTAEPSGRVNGRHVDGVHHAGEESRVTRQAPVSAPPDGEPRREIDGDRPVVPAQRPAPAVEQPSAEAEPPPSRHSSDDPGRAPRRTEGGGPTSAPPALQVPPVGAAASGFEVPPGFHAPTVDRGATDPPPSLSRGWADRVAPEPAPEPPSLSRGWADRPSSAPPVAGPAEEPRATVADDRRAGPAGGSRFAPAEEAEWSEPSWGGGWAPARPYEPGRAEQPSGYGPPPTEPTPYEVPRAEAEPRPAYEPRETRERPSWAGPPVPVTPLGAPPHAAPTSAPPVPREAPASAPPAAYPAAGSPPAEESEPYRPRSVADETPGLVPSPAATSGGTRFDRTPAPEQPSAPPYAARRSAPEPVPAAEPVADTRPAEPAAVLPQRVPAEPDVPVVPEPPAVEPSAETPELARIATHLRRDDEPAPLRERPEGFDVNAILDAVREVPGVRDAALRRTPAGAHSLRLDLADGADPAEVSRVVARLLQERMGLAAAPQNLPGAPAAAPPPVRRRSGPARGERAAGEPRLGEGRPVAAQPVPGRSPEGRAAEGRLGAPEARSGRVAKAPAEGTEPPRRRRQGAGHRGRATVEEASLATGPAGTATGSPATLGTSYSGGQMTTTETAPSRPLHTGGTAGPRVVIDHVQVSTFGLDATVEVRLIAADRTAEGYATGPAVDGYVLRLCAVAAAAAVDELLGRVASSAERGRCFVEHAAVVPFGNCEVATVVVLLVCDGWVEQLAGSALVAGDPRQAVVRATLDAVNRRLEALLA